MDHQVHSLGGRPIQDTPEALYQIVPATRSIQARTDGQVRANVRVGGVQDSKWAVHIRNLDDCTAAEKRILGFCLAIVRIGLATEIGVDSVLGHSLSTTDPPAAPAGYGVAVDRVEPNAP